MKVRQEVNNETTRKTMRRVRTVMVSVPRTKEALKLSKRLVVFLVDFLAIAECCRMAKTLGERRIKAWISITRIRIITGTISLML